MKEAKTTILMARNPQESLAFEFGMFKFGCKNRITQNNSGLNRIDVHCSIKRSPVRVRYDSSRATQASSVLLIYFASI